MRRRFLLLANPIAGRRNHRLTDQVCQALREAGAEVGPVPATSPQAALAAAREAAEAGRLDALIVAGGDGSVRLGARAVAGTDVPLGVIPLGTGNVLANEVGLPRDAGALAQVLLSGPVDEICTATANGELFVLWAGAGFDGAVIGSLNREQVGRFGKGAYLAPMTRHLASRAAPFTVRLDGQDHHATWVIFSNASRYGGRFRLTSRTALDRPGLVAVLVDAPTRWRLTAALVALAAGRLEGLPFTRVVPCRSASISAPRPVQIDGDAAGTTTLDVDATGPRLLLIRPAERR